MEFLELAKKRYSCRKYQEKKIEKELLLQVLEAGRMAPSAVNFQPWEYIIVQEEKTLKQVKSCYQKEWINTAPCIIVICGDHGQSWKRDDGKDHCDIDIAITTDHLTLAATANGLATCWVCKFDAEKCKSIFNLPDHLEPMVLLPIGYPANEEVNERHLKRKNMEKIIHWNKYIENSSSNE